MSAVSRQEKLKTLHTVTWPDTEVVFAFISALLANSY